MASGSSTVGNIPGSKAYDFASNDVLCSYEDYPNHDSSNGVGPNSNKDFHKTRMSRSSVFPTINVCSQPEESLSQEVISTVERTMKNYADNIMRFLEGISSRLSQLELYCYNLDKSIGEMRSNLVHDHCEADSKLKSLDKHLQEVHRSVQILRDKQELAETQKELAKLQLAKKDSASSGHSQHEERSVSPSSDSKKDDDVSEPPNTHMALALPHQIQTQPSYPITPVQHQQPPVAPPPLQPSTQSMAQLPPYYLPSTQLPHVMPAQSQPPQSSYLPPVPQYRAPQLAPQPPQNQANQAPLAHQLSQYQQQWPQQVTQPLQQPQMPPQTQLRAPQSSVHPSYMSSQLPNLPPPETLTGSMPMQVPFSGVPHPAVSPPEAMPYGYGGAVRSTPPPPPPPHMKGGYPSQPGDGYATGGTHAPISSAGPYIMYESPQPSPFPHGGYLPAANVSLPNPHPPTTTSLVVRNPNLPQLVRNHPYNELIDKLVSMGYRGEHVVSVIQRLEESEQPVDFNAVLDRLNGHPPGSSQRGGW